MLTRASESWGLNEEGRGPAREKGAGESGCRMRPVWVKRKERRKGHVKEMKLQHGYYCGWIHEYTNSGQSQDFIHRYKVPLFSAPGFILSIPQLLIPKAPHSAPLWSFVSQGFPSCSFVKTARALVLNPASSTRAPGERKELSPC